MDVLEVQHLVQKIKTNIQRVMVGKDETIDQLLVALISSGHVLLEDVPGTGKTLLAKSMAKSLSCSFKRIQFTPDLLPTDVTGINFYNQKKGEFEFRPGPLFSNILLADEINRATPRTQSSLLESMEERQVTIDGDTRALQAPFIVIATQNPLESQGTFPLPEAQLDRFLLKINLGYPTRQEGIDILRRFKKSNPLENLEAVASQQDILQIQHFYSSTYVSDDLLAYIMDIVEKTRVHANIAVGVSPRGSQALFKAVQAHAVIQGRDYVLPDDVKQMVKPVLSHRIQIRRMAGLKSNPADSILDEIIETVVVPSEAGVLESK
ncbi:AAA family ATPase [Aquibacillus rhizosphaerae]|uniref:MoxR family ATPase n=1 Tax=Aquibacillus rhizosphaerae TaxID=3051431 RepID=A0ABT7LA20_9BACI|nr:MoxR family ATPase [Aquibacillus sp. LR5S19]MDL4842239.1 MoxR family ATPase [Aquibacillus sp. LR5S19]